MKPSRALPPLLFAVLLLGLILAASNLLVSTLAISLLIFAGVMFGIFLNGLSRLLPLPYRWSYTLVVFTLISLIVAAGFILGSQIAARISEFSEQVQSAGEQLLEQNPRIRQYVPDADKVHTMITDGGTNVLPEVMKGMWWLTWGITGLIVIFFVGLYVAYDPELYETGLVKLVAREQRDRASDVLQTLRRALMKWIVARIISMTLVGICTALALWILGVPLPITLGVLAALLTFIPNIGPILATVPQALLAFQVGTNTVMYVILFNLVLQMVESYLLTPIIERYEVSLPPVLTIFAQLLMGVTVGIIGVIMAAPLTVTLMVLTQILYIRDGLGDPSPGRLVEKAEEE